MPKKPKPMIVKKMFNNSKRTMLLLLWLACSSAVLAQQQVVTGSIKDPNGAGLAGVTVLVKGTSAGTLTDAGGRYSIQAAGNATLVFSFIGYVTQEIAIGNRPVVDVVLEENLQALGEVVVTALGVERNTKSLQSSVTKVPGVSLTQARETNFGASIQGRVAGVNVTKNGSGPAGSSRVIIRGNKSLNGSNQPLYVVDGIPMDNNQFGNAGVWGGIDQGDGLSSINPDDIESISVLKGANAAALYGSRGGYGVINITTKKGTSRKGIGVEFNSNYVLESVINLTDLQQVYGSGGMASSNPADPTAPEVGSKPTNQQQAWDWGNRSWGAKLDGTPVVQFDGVVRPYSYAGDNWKRFYNTGYTWTNSLALSGGNENQTFRFSYSDLQNKGIVPNTGFNRRNLSLNTNGKFGKKVTFNAKVLYDNEDTKNRPTLADSPGNAIQGVYKLPPNVNIDDLKGDPKKPGSIPVGLTMPSGRAPGTELLPANDNWGSNPWWSAYQWQANSIRDRFITSAQLKYDILPWLYIQGKVGMDFYVRKSRTLKPQGTGDQLGGSASEREDRVREINQEWMLGVNKTFGKINFIGFIGGNKMVNTNENVSANGSSFNVDWFTSVNNLSSQNFGYGYTKYGINSLFGSAEISYNGFLYVTATGRNDWFSVLNPANNSKFYPSIGTSFIFTDAFKNLPTVLSFGKIRASWGQVATATVTPYSVNNSYGLNGQGHMGKPMAQYAFANNGYNIPNANLVPALSTEIELGTELRFLENRLGIDFTYYDQKSTDDILQGTISNTTGFLSTYMNLGELSNKGVEILLTVTPVKGPVTWDISLNMAKNKSKVVSLIPGMTSLDLEEPRTRTVRVQQIVGKPYGMISGWVQAKDPNGNLIYNIDGIPQRSAGYVPIGNGVADVTGGMNNSVTYKGISLSFLLDFKFGGDIYSGTNVRLDEWGLSKASLKRLAGDIAVKGVYNSGTASNPIYTPIDRVLTEREAYNYWQNMPENVESNYIYDASFIKLRQISLEYNLPASLLSKTPIKTLGVSIVARNLAILYKNVPNVDPESSYTNSNSQGLDYFGMPTSRTYGFNVRVTF